MIKTWIVAFATVVSLVLAGCSLEENSLSEEVFTENKVDNFSMNNDWSQETLVTYFEEMGFTQVEERATNTIQGMTSEVKVLTHASLSELEVNVGAIEAPDYTEQEIVSLQFVSVNDDEIKAFLDESQYDEKSDEILESTHFEPIEIKDALILSMPKGQETNEKPLYQVTIYNNEDYIELDRVIQKIANEQNQE